MLSHFHWKLLRFCTFAIDSRSEIACFYEMRLVFQKSQFFITIKTSMMEKEWLIIKMSSVQFLANSCFSFEWENSVPSSGISREGSRTPSVSQIELIVVTVITLPLTLVKKSPNFYVVGVLEGTFECFVHITKPCNGCVHNYWWCNKVSNMSDKNTGSSKFRALSSVIFILVGFSGNPRKCRKTKCKNKKVQQRFQGTCSAILDSP